MKQKFELATNTKTGEASIKCLQCQMISFNRNDIKYRYCGNCGHFLDVGYIRRILSLRPCTYDSVDINLGIDLATSVLIKHKVDDSIIEEVVKIKRPY